VVFAIERPGASSITEYLWRPAQQRTLAATDPRQVLEKQLESRRERFWCHGVLREHEYHLTLGRTPEGIVQDDLIVVQNRARGALQCSSGFLVAG
jgi:hypothetical protein